MASKGPCWPKHPGSSIGHSREEIEQVSFLDTRSAKTQDERLKGSGVDRRCWQDEDLLRGASRFKVFPCSLSSCFVIPFSIVITSLREEEAGLCASRAFVCFVRVSFCHFFWPSQWGTCSLVPLEKMALFPCFPKSKS